MSLPGPEIWKEFGRLNSYIKGKQTKEIVIRKTKIMKNVMFCGYNYATDKDTRNSVIGLVATLGGTLVMCLSKTRGL